MNTEVRYYYSQAEAFPLGSAVIDLREIARNIAEDSRNQLIPVPNRPCEVRWTSRDKPNEEDPFPLTYVFNSELQAVMFVLEFKRLRGEA